MWEFRATSLQLLKKRNEVYTRINSDEITRELLPSRIHFSELTNSVSSELIPLSPLILAEGYSYNRDVISQAAAVVTGEVMDLYKWPAYTLGRIVKFDLDLEGEILATCHLAYPVREEFEADTVLEYTDDIVLYSMTEKDGYIWALGKVNSTNTLRHARNINTVILVIDGNLPKQLNDFETDGVDFENIPSYSAVKRSFFLCDDLSSFDVRSMNFTSFDKMRIDLVDGGINKHYLLELQYNYYTEDIESQQVITLRNHRLDNTDSSLVIC